jgi:DNA-binding LacI/PurR family transcriptional regulator
MSDVAVVAGVSHQTVSRVLNNHPNVRDATRERVLEAIATLGYRRNSAARTLVTRRSGTIGVVTPASALYGPTSTLVGLEEAARIDGLFVSVATIRAFDGETMHRALEHFLGQGVDGIAIIAPTVEVGRLLAAVHLPLPVVAISSSPEVSALEHVNGVGVDQRGGARLATRHLIDAGYDEVLHVAGPQDWYDAQDRLVGWLEECAAAHVRPLGPVEVGWDAADGYAVGLKLLSEGLPRAIFAANDQISLGLLHAFWKNGVRVPEDVALVGFDDEVGSAHFAPPLTTVRQDFGALGRMAMESLTAAMEGADNIHRMIPAELVVRESAPADFASSRTGHGS